MKYLLPVIVLLTMLTGCVSTSKFQTLEHRVDELAIKESCARLTLEVLLMAQHAADPSNFEDEGKYIDAQFVFTAMKNDQQLACHKYQMLRRD